MNIVWTLAMAALGLALASSLAGLFATARRPALLRGLSLPLFALSGLAALACGLLALADGGSITLQLPLGLPWLPWQLRLDALSGFFLVLLGALTLAVGIYGVGYVRDFERGRDQLPPLGAFSGLFLLGMELVLMADGAYLFMVAWELMTLSSYFLVAFQHDNAANRRAAFLYLLMGHISGLCILLAFGVLASFSGSFAFAAMRAAHPDFLWASVAFALAFTGFGIKAGLVPVHAWLPEAHPAAPSHISALMSGAMLKVAVYGFLRVVFDLIGPLHWQWGVVVLTVGSLSALLGVLLALMQTDLKRLLAYSSVENLGIVFIGLGLSLIFLGTGHRLLGALALVAALYHALNHALFKGLLFMGAGAILHSAHERDLDRMGGLLRRMPWTGTFFLIGSLAISGLPPLNGFVSEWFTFQAALQTWQLHSGLLRTLIPVAAAVLALSAALAAAAFVKAYGVAFLGRARTRQVRRARQVPVNMRVGQGLLALGCLAAGVFPSTVIAWIVRVPQSLLGSGLPQAGAQGWLWLTPVSPTTASYSAPGVLLALLVLAGLTAWLVHWGAVRRVRRSDAWDCGLAPPTPRMQYTATGFAQPLRRVFGAWLRVDEGVDAGEGATPRHRLQITDRSWALFYAPVVRVLDRLTRLVTRMQAGHLRVYLAWTLGTLLLLLWVVTL
ncbi:hydrogenase 4 subunit B [Acidihalobacter aeolianus]|uniref:Hydrogenase 4 subunit B n=2 Tax=Acidihalobacter aeolianus TaxID=2792603 RepID=A0A1D8K8L6_9GAMM|nr:hydrogenase 4 subunit B [Acidihalobacter aeolianus]